MSRCCQCEKEVNAKSTRKHSLVEGEGSSTGIWADGLKVTYEHWPGVPSRTLSSTQPRASNTSIHRTKALRLMKQTNIYLIVFPRYNPTEVDGRNAAEPMEVHKQTRLKPTCRGGLDTDPTRTWWSQGVTHTNLEA